MLVAFDANEAGGVKDTTEFEDSLLMFSILEIYIIIIVFQNCYKSDC